MDKQKSHTTTNEKKFIQSLGGFSLCGATRKELLTGYINAAEKREDWGLVDKGEVLAYANQQLQELFSMRYPATEFVSA